MEPDHFELLSDRIHYQIQNGISESAWPSLVRDAAALIEAEYAYLYGIDELADRLEVSKHHLIRLFSANTGISPGKYLIDIRISHAKLLLQSRGNTPVEIIAGACGYSCANYFSKVFRKHTGLTPTEYRELSPVRPGLSADRSVEKFYL